MKFAPPKINTFPPSNHHIFFHTRNSISTPFPWEKSAVRARWIYGMQTTIHTRKMQIFDAKTLRGGNVGRKLCAEEVPHFLTSEKVLKKDTKISQNGQSMHKTVLKTAILTFKSIWD